MEDDEIEGPGPKAKAKPDKKKLRQQIQDLKMDKRVGVYTSNPDQPTRGIFKAPRPEQRAFRKKLRQQISDLRSQN